MRGRYFITVISVSLLPVFVSLLIAVPDEPAWSQSGKSIRIIVPFHIADLSISASDNGWLRSEFRWKSPGLQPERPEGVRPQG
jgi:hypothetical protein